MVDDLHDFEFPDPEAAREFYEGVSSEDAVGAMRGLGVMLLTAPVFLAIYVAVIAWIL